MFRRVASRTVGLAGVIALLCGGVALAAAGGSGTVTETQHEHSVVLFSHPAKNPCTGEPGTFTAVATNSVFHVTFFENGTEFWATGTAEGIATFTPEQPEGISASGHFATWFGESHNNKNEVEHSTSNFNLTGSDGSHIVIHGASHLSTNGSGVVTVNFEQKDVHCG
jgi:hypothetical protein